LSFKLLNISNCFNSLISICTSRNYYGSLAFFN
jgi:hypothetical protein